MKDNDKPDAWDRFKLFQPFITCPPERPLRRVGPQGDGGKWLCDPGPERAPCAVLSLGSNMDFGFEHAILSETPCRVVTADCTVNGDKLGDRHTFLRACVGGFDHAIADPKILTYSDMMRRGGLDAVTILKIDVEGYEYPVLAEWKESSRGLPDQISIELHWKKFDIPHPEGLPMLYGRKEFGILDLALFMDHLVDLGYGIVSQEINPGCPGCSEFTFVRVR
ncbi:hypothetical protein GPECTOR_26g501 [Gonium pectorale]|uniref:Methyltransferase domain-containing protein n=1 Tax=Gonium pectorale TaxID=33097 RepID=A0A150GFI6_GONPE|nr:hypothetical protein GPECTOR_26g501 [Gonium pectorale]|eukprot:KXZ48598.1 hypothetical protein GPECTOR_26g501 [Gonium pectorale]